MTVESEGTAKESQTKNERKEKMILPPTKVVIRKLPPSFTEEEFLEVVSPLPENTYFYFAVADKRLGSAAFSRAYINFTNTEDVIMFRNMYDSYVFVDQKGDEYPAIVEYAPFQKVPKHSVNPTKDPRCGTIEEDPDYISFLESLENPETISLPHMEQVVEEIEAKDRELRANHGLLKVKTPLLEFIEKRQSEKLLQFERRKKKEIERRKAKEEEKKRRKEQFNKKEEISKKRDGKPSDKTDKKETAKPSIDPEEKAGRPKKFSKEFAASKYKKESVAEEPRTKRYSELRKQGEKKTKELDSKSNTSKIQPKYSDSTKSKVPFRKTEKGSTKETIEKYQKKETTEKYQKKENSTKSEEKPHKEKIEKREEQEKTGEASENSEDAAAAARDLRKEAGDARKERRIRNKDRPDMQLYRPGQSRLKSRLGNTESNTALVSDSSSSVSPVESLGKDLNEKRGKEPFKFPKEPSIEAKPHENPKEVEESTATSEPKKPFSYSQYRAANKRDVKTMTFERSPKPK